MKITECPRDAMQGIHQFIPTETKVTYLNALLKVGFDVLDFGSFVSPKVIPQMKDTAEVLSKLELNPNTKMLAIVANERGANDAIQFKAIDILGFPFSVSETFQQRNTNSNLQDALDTVKRMYELSEKHQKTLLIYLSMAFGNPYGDAWSEDIVADWMDNIASLGIHHFALADTIGVSTPSSIESLYGTCKKAHTTLNIGLHVHTTPQQTDEKINAILNCNPDFIDGAIKGLGGCPMAKDDLTGNLATEKLLARMNALNLKHNINPRSFEYALQLSTDIF